MDKECNLESAEDYRKSEAESAHAATQAFIVKVDTFSKTQYFLRNTSFV